MKQSAGLLLFRRREGKLEVLLTHPAGPFWAHKDTWSIPKGELDEHEDHLAAAFREFDEEIGFLPSRENLIDLGSIKQPDGRKVNFIWAIEQDFDIRDFVCRSTFSLEWPLKSGTFQEFPENDRAEWFDLPTAKSKLFKAQIGFIDRLAEQVGTDKSQLPEQPSLL